MTEVQTGIIADLAYLDFPSKVEGGLACRFDITVGELAKMLPGDARLTRAIDAGMSDWRMSDVMDDTGFTGFFAATFTGPDGQQVVAFRGTEPMRDLSADAKSDAQLLYESTTQQQAKVGEYLSRYGSNLNQGFTFSGHSLGGNLALFAAVTAGSALQDKMAGCMAFNAPGFNDEFLRDFGGQIEAVRFKIMEFQNEHDFVSSLLNNLTEPIVVREASWSIAAHGIAEMQHDGEFFTRSDGGKDVVCNCMHLLTEVLDALPRELTKGLVDTVFAIASNRFTAAALLIALITSPGRLLPTIGVVLAGVVALSLRAPLSDAAKRFGETMTALLDWLAEETNRFVKGVIDKAVSTGVFLAGLAAGMWNDLKSASKCFFERVKGFLAWVTGGSGWAQGPVSVNAGVLRSAAATLGGVQNRVVSVDRRLDRLRSLVDPATALAVAHIDLAVGYDRSIAGCASYLNTAAQRFESVEASLVTSARRSR